MTLPVGKRIEALVDVIRESGVTAKEGVMALPLAQSFVTIMSLAAKADEDVSSRVNVEARKYIPVPISDVVFEWSEIPQDEKDPVLQKDILLAAIQNEAIADVKSILDSLQMNTQPFEIELFSALRSLTKQSDTSIALIDLGASMSKLYIAKDGFLRRIHRAPSGGAFATQMIATKLAISYEDAENAKRNYIQASERGPIIKKVMGDTFERTFSEFKRVVDQYELRTGQPIGRIVLTGGSTLFPEMEAYASYALGKPIEMGNPFLKVAYPAFMEDTMRDIGSVFAVALGAALRAFEK